MCKRTRQSSKKGTAPSTSSKKIRQGERSNNQRRATTAHTSAQSSSPARPQSPAQSSAVPTSTSTKPVLDSKEFADLLQFKDQHDLKNLRYGDESSKKLLAHCIAICEILEKHAYPGGLNENMKSPLQMFKDTNFWNFIQYVWRVSDMHSSDAYKKKIVSTGVKGVKAIFQKFFKVDITEYFPDEATMQKTYESDTGPGNNWSIFVKRVTMYHCRFDQNSCAVLDCILESGKRRHKVFGGAGCSESDHALENYFKVIGILKKMFGFDVKACQKGWPEFLAEFAKTLSTCCPHHQHDASCDSCFHDLPNQVSVQYHLFSSSQYCVEIGQTNPVAPSQIMDNKDGKAMERLTDKYINMSDKRLEKVSFEEISQDYSSNGPFEFVDIHRQTKKKWESSNASQRRHSIQRTEITATKTMGRTCFCCGMNALEMAAKAKSSLHLHHMKENKKSHNPSEGPKKSIHEQRSENRKTIMLCSGCHTLITHCKWENERLVAKFKELGYQINEETGEITCSKPYDGLYIGTAK